MAYFGLQWRVLPALILLASCFYPESSQASPQVKNLVTTNPTSLQFGNVQVGSNANLYETVTNVGHVTITASSATISGSGFSYSGLTFPLILPPGHSYTFTATFAPTVAGNATGAITLYADRGTLTIPMGGTGIAAGTLSVTPSSLNFGTVNIGKTSQLSAMLIASGGSVTVTAGSINNSQFTLSGISFPFTLQSGQSMPFTVTFAPQQTGAVSASLDFVNAPNAPAVEALAGTGSNPPPPPSVTLSWDGSPPPVSGYNVFRGTVSGGPYSQLNSTLDPATAYTDTTVVSGQVYYYVTTAVNSSGEQSTYSNQVTAIIP